MKKRILALMLACFMIVSLLPMQVFAEETVAGKCPGEGNDHAKENCTYEVFKVVEPTCDDWGYTIYACDVCGDHFVDDITEKRGEHNWVEQVRVEATCTEEGIYGGVYCDICMENAHNAEGTGALDVIPAGHLMSDPVGDCIYAISECLREGCDYQEITTGKHCYVTSDGSFNIIMTNVGAGLESEDIVVTNNTCGIAYYECVVCGYIHEVEIVHELVFVEGADGYCDHYACETCGRTFSVRSAETGYYHDEFWWLWIPGYLGEFDAMMDGEYDHLYELPELEEINPYEVHAWQYVETIYTLNEFGHITCGDTTDVYVCTICGWEEERDGGYHHTDRKWEHTTDATCETWGVEFYFCTGCGETWTEQVEEPLGHLWGEDDGWYQIACNADGTATDQRDCLRCGYYETRTRDCNGDPHQKIEWRRLDPNCSTQGYSYWYCEICWENGIDVLEKDLDAHYGELLYIVEPTCTEDGFEFWYCHWCDSNYTVVLEKLNHEIHTITYDSCGYLHVEKSCAYCDYFEYVFEEKNPEDIFVFGPEYEVEDIAAIHGVHYTYEITYRNGDYEMVDDLNWQGFDQVMNHKEPTCGYYGYDEYYCYMCMSEFIHIIAPTGIHRFEGELESYVVDASKPNKEIDGWFGPQLVAEVFYGVDYKGGTISFTVTSEYWAGEVNFFTADGKTIWEWEYGYYANQDYSVYTFVDAEGNDAWSVSFTYPDEYTTVFTFEDLDYVGIDILCNYGTFTVVPYLKSDVTPAKDCTAEEGAGWDEHKYCIDCRQMVGGNEHVWEPVGPAKQPTCTENGLIAGWYCADCDKYFTEVNGVMTEVSTLVIPKLGHEIVVNYDVHVDEQTIYIFNDCRYVDYTQNPFLFNYCHIVCENGCGLEFIDDYHEHTWVLNEEDSYAPTCTETGSNFYDCECGAVWEEIVPANGHTYGEPTNDYCGKCEVCGFEALHDAHVIATMPATCSTGAYDLYHCDLCGYEWAVTTSEAVDPEIDGEVAYFNSHVWGESTEVLDENGHGTGVWVKACTLCGYIHTWDADRFVNYYLGAADEIYVPGSTIAVTITLDANYAEIWGFDLNVYFDSEEVTFVGASSSTEAFNYLIDANENVSETLGHYVSVAATATENALIVEEVTITLYFQAVKCGRVDFELQVLDTLDLEGNSITSYAHDLYVIVYRIMDLNTNWTIDLDDLRLCYLLITSADAEYNVIADADCDGDVDIDDLLAIYQYILNN